MAETIAFKFKGGQLDGSTIQSQDLTWPPPEWVVIEGIGGFYKKVRQSILTDEEMKELTFVIRGAEYEYKTNAEADFGLAQEVTNG